MGAQQQGTNVTQTPANIPGMILGGGMTAAGLMTGNPFMALNGAKTAGLGLLGGAAAR
jgi:hypothetical protein